MVHRYDPLEAPDPEEWLDLDEQERMLLVEQHHRRAQEEMGNHATLHAATHAVVETQAAMGIDAVRRALERLQDEGLDRHDAVHAVGSVLAEHLVELMKGNVPKEGSQAWYATQLDALTADGWKRSFAEPPSP